MATAIEGCIVLGMDGNLVRYQKKCEKCGYVDSSKLKTGTVFTTWHGSFNCPKCKNHQKMTIKV